MVLMCSGAGAGAGLGGRRQHRRLPAEGRGGRATATTCCANNLSFLVFDIADFNGPAVGGDFFVSVGSFVEVGVGLGYYQRTVPTVYDRFVDEDGTEIEQDMKLRDHARDAHGAAVPAEP